MPVIERAGGEKNERDQPGERAAQAASQPPGEEQADQAHGGTDEAARFKQTERQNLCGKRGKKVEPAAIHVEVYEGQRASVGKPRAVKREQQAAILRMGVIVPAEAVVAKGECGDRGDRYQRTNRNSIEPMRGDGRGREREGGVYRGIERGRAGLGDALCTNVQNVILSDLGRSANV